MNASRELERLKSAGLYRACVTLEGPPAAEIRLGRKTLVNFSSNNTLGLANDPRVKEAACSALMRLGLGATSSRLLGGSLEVHAELENSLARFLGFEAALVFSSGYHANAGFLRALTSPGDFVIIDRNVHASLIDGCRLSPARLLVFAHNDFGALDRALRRASCGGERIVLTEGIFSMDGDAAPLAEISGVCRRHGALLAVDEAHALGVLGESGRGLSEAQGVLHRIDIYIGTLSKALGSQGGFIAAKRDTVDLIRNRCRSFIFTTALAVPCAAGALEALKILREERWRARRLLSLAEELKGALKSLGFDTLGSAAHIVPVLMGDAETAQRAARILIDAGFFAPAIRPPTVPEGSSRIRISLTTEHPSAVIHGVAEVLGRLGPRIKGGEPAVV